MAKINVIDGCTFEIGSQTVRLAGVNAPEWGADFFDESTEYLEKLIVDKDLKLSVVGVAYGEGVVKVWVGEEDINETMKNFLNDNGYTYKKAPGSLRLRRFR